MLGVEHPAATFHGRAHNYDNLRAAVVRILVGGARTLTPRFTALASHYLLEACFCRPGEGHDKGGVEARGKAVRQQALVPIPRGPTLAGINATLLAQMDARLDTTRDAAGQTIGTRFAEEQRLFRLAPTPFAPEATTLATVTPRALVRLEGAVYSVPSRWAGLDLVVRIGATTVTIVGREGTRILHPRQRFGQRSIDYRHYLSELARKPQAVRQVLPDLLRDLGAPFPAILGSAPRGARAAGGRAALRQSPRPARHARRGRRRARADRRARDRDAAAARAHAGAVAPPASRQTPCRPRCATSTSPAAVPPTMTAGSWRWAHERPHDGPRSRRRPHAGAEAARRGPHV